MIVLPREAFKFPLAFAPPAGFAPDDFTTWPKIEGRLEYVDGRLELMPPCGGMQQVVAPEVTTELVLWCRANPGFDCGSNEAGMKLGGDVRGVDVGLWRKTDAPRTHQSSPRAAASP